MTTAADIIAETKRYLYSTHRDPMNRLNGSLTNSATTVTLEFALGSITPGAYIAVDLEIMYVFSITESALTAVVQRGMLGSTAAAHNDDSLVIVNPKFSDFTILQAINADLADLSSPVNGLYQAKNVTLTYNPAFAGYNLTSVSDLIDILRVKYEDVGVEKIWPDITRWSLKRLSDTTDFASGNALVIYEGGQSGRDIRVAYSAPFTAFTLTTQDATTYAGLPATATDIPALGAAVRLQLTREGQRNFNESQGDTRRAEEVPPGAQLTGARGLIQLRQTRIQAEAARLTRAWPTRRKVA